LTSSLRPGPDWAKHLSVLLAVVSTGAVLIARFSKLEEANETKTAIISTLQREVENLKREREMLATTVARIDERTDRLSDDMREVKSDVKEINGKVSKRRW
jgi:septal ring factor EnvC (AmiA/AmiB activator)